MDIIKAKQLLQENDYTCVAVKGESIYTSCFRGVKPLMTWLKEGVDLNGFSAADKVIGKATAFLYVQLGIKCVHAQVISDGAVEVLTHYAVPFTYSDRVASILNRKKDGFCPMESSVIHIDKIEEALPVIEKRYHELNG